MTITPQFKLSQDENSVIVTIRVPYIRIANAEIWAENCDFSFYCSPYLLKLHLPYPIRNDPEVQKAQYDISKDNGTLTITLPKALTGQFFPSLDLLQHLVGGNNQQSTRRNDPHNAIKLFDEARDIGYNYGFYCRYGDMLHTHTDLVYEMFDIHNIFESHAIERKYLMYCRENEQFDMERWLFDEIEGHTDSHYTTLMQSAPFWHKYYDMYVKKKPKPIYSTETRNNAESVFPANSTHPTENNAPSSYDATAESSQAATATTANSDSAARSLLVDQWYVELFGDVLGAQERDALGAIRGNKGLLSMPRAGVEEISGSHVGDVDKEEEQASGVRSIGTSQVSPRYCLELMTELFFAYAYVLRFQGEGLGVDDAGEEDATAGAGIEYSGGQGAEGGTEVTHELVFSFVSLCPSLRYLIPPGSYSKHTSSSSSSSSPALLPLLHVLARRFYLTSYLRHTHVLRRLLGDTVKLFFCGKRVCLKVLVAISRLLQKSTFFYLFDKLYMQDLLAYILRGDGATNDGNKEDEWSGGITESDFYFYAKELNEAKNAFEAKDCLLGKAGTGWFMAEVEGGVREYMARRSAEEEDGLGDEMGIEEIRLVAGKVMRAIRRGQEEEQSAGKETDGPHQDGDSSTSSSSSSSSDHDSDSDSASGDDNDGENPMAAAANYDVGFLHSVYGDKVEYLLRMQSDYSAFMQNKAKEGVGKEEGEDKDEEWNAARELARLLGTEQEVDKEGDATAEAIISKGGESIDELMIGQRAAPAPSKLIQVLSDEGQEAGGGGAGGGGEWKMKAISTKRRVQGDSSQGVEAALVRDMRQCSLEADESSVV